MTSRTTPARAAAAGLALQEAAAAGPAAHPDWPRFRVGINSGIASVSLLGTEGGRTHTVIGDTVNVASRIEGKAPGGGVAIGPGTKALLPDAVTESIGLLDLKGKAEPMEVHRLISLRPTPLPTPHHRHPHLTPATGPWWAQRAHQPDWRGSPYSSRRNDHPVRCRVRGGIAG